MSKSSGVVSSRDTIAFNVYRVTNGKRTMLNALPVVDATSFVDTQAGRGRDNSQAGITTEPILEAYISIHVMPVLSHG
jgi:hypothetical protein